MGINLDLMYQCVADPAEYQSFTGQPEKEKRKRLKAAGKAILDPALYDVLLDFLDNRVSRLSSSRHDLMHHAWASGRSADEFLLLSNRPAKGVKEVVSTSTLQQLLIEYKKANHDGQSLLLAVHANSPKAPPMLSLRP